ncbi:MAG: UPF0175 family protein [Caldilineaceae bacterium]|nr:UPF0175 family protein [Caldilineaceae bacterium]
MAVTPVQEDEALRWSVVVSAYLDEEISLARAASLLDVHPLELREMFVAEGIPLLLGPEDGTDAQAEIDAVRARKRTGSNPIRFSSSTFSVSRRAAAGVTLPHHRSIPHVLRRSHELQGVD